MVFDAADWANPTVRRCRTGSDIWELTCIGSIILLNNLRPSGNHPGSDSSSGYISKSKRTNCKGPNWKAVKLERCIRWVQSERATQRWERWPKLLIFSPREYALLPVWWLPSSATPSRLFFFFFNGNCLTVNEAFPRFICCWRFHHHHVFSPFCTLSFSASLFVQTYY